mgnify:CR=1 FL=1
MKTKPVHKRSALSVRQRSRVVNKLARQKNKSVAQQLCESLADSRLLLTTIRNDIPIPSPRGASKGYSAVLRTLEGGDSVSLPITVNSARALAHRVLGAGNYTIRFEEGGARIWRNTQ